MSGRAQLGFTLLEVVVAVALAGVIFVSMVAGLQLANRALDRGRQGVETMQQNLSGLQALHSEISSAVPLALATTEAGQVRWQFCFRGETQRVWFVTRYSWTGDRSRKLWIATLEVTHTPAGKQQLVLRESAALDDQRLRSVFHGTPATTAHRSVAVGKAADHIEFAYLLPGSESMPPAWLPEWQGDQERMLPRGLRVAFSQDQKTDFLTFWLPAGGTRR